MSMKLKRNETIREESPNRMLRAIMEYWSISLAVWLGVAGLITLYFNIITPVTVLANLIVIPLSTALVALGFGLLFVSVVMPAWSYPFVCCIKLILNAMVGMIYLFAQWPFAYIYITGITLWQVMGYYLFLSMLISFPWKKRTVDRVRIFE